MRFRRKQVLALMFVAAVASCDGDELPPGPPPGPAGPGFLQVVLDTPNNNTGGLLVTISGGPIDSVQSTQFTVRTAEIAPNQHQIIVAGALRDANVIFRFWIPDLGVMNGYRATLQQAAARGLYNQLSTEGYAFRIALD
jgi:hypothetical protein